MHTKHSTRAAHHTPDVARPETPRARGTPAPPTKVVQQVYLLHLHLVGGEPVVRGPVGWRGGAGGLSKDEDGGIRDASDR
jgi:hypothetical protein